MRLIRGAAVVAAASAVLLSSGCAGTATRDGAAVTGSASADRDLAPATVAKLDSAIAAAVQSAKIPGAMVGIWSPDGNYVKAFGVADTSTAAPMRTDFYSRIGSVTKTFTATALLQLVADGKLGLDDPVGRYVDGVPGGAAITLRQLAGMRSGLPDYQDNPDFEAAVAANPIRDFTPRELLGWAFAKPSAFPPGQGFGYSNTNYILLGLVVEKAGGVPLAAYLTEHILGPLGLSHTSFPSEMQFPDPHAQGYTEPPDEGGPPVDATDWTASFTWAAGAMISTLDDLRIWVPAVATGVLLPPGLQQDRLRGIPGPGSPEGFTYGLGIATTAGWVGHNGSVPGYQTVAFYLPQRQITMVVMTNTDIGTPGSMSPDTAVAKAITTILTPDHIYNL